MRKEKYNQEESDDDIKYALGDNAQGDLLKEIDVIVAEVCGANDEASWHWILKMKDGTFRYVSGWCDYTGWDCQSGCTVSDAFHLIEEAVVQAPELDSDKRKIREVLSKQVAEEIPFAVYQE